MIPELNARLLYMKVIVLIEICKTSSFKQPSRHSENHMATARGFEPLRAEPNGFRVHLLNRSDTLSWSKDAEFKPQGKPRCPCAWVEYGKKEQIGTALERKQ